VCFGDSPHYTFFSQAREGAALRISGMTGFYQNRASPRIEKAEFLSDEELAAGDLLDRLIPASREDPDALWAELMAYVEEVQMEPLRATVSQALNETASAFRSRAAAISMHHAYRCGLLEHTVHLCRAGKSLLPFYPFVNADLAMSGLILHDIGKTIEYTDGLVTSKSREGILHGHVVLGYRIARKAAIQARLPEDIRERLEHVILSHQGELEWGAAAMAATPEAVFVSMLDNLDAKLAMVENALQTTPDSHEFSDYIAGLKTPVLTRVITP